MNFFAPSILALLLGTSSMFARLGENEVQSKARYGEPNPGLIGANDKPLIAGAKENAYLFEGWRVRAAFVNGVTHRIEYVKIPEGGALKNIAVPEALAILEAEKDRYSWREQKPKTGHQALNDLKQVFEGQRWERSDHADAILKLNLVLVLQSKDAEKLEKQIAKTASKSTPAPGATPKF
jgi:hypothetical protein